MVDEWVFVLVLGTGAMPQRPIYENSDLGSSQVAVKHTHLAQTAQATSCLCNYFQAKTTTNRTYATTV